jgi:hypothetical protein
MTLISRSEWGAASPRKTVPLRSPKGVAIHWVGVPVKVVLGCSGCS